MSYPRTIRNFNAFVDGVGYFGIATEAKLPVVKVQTEANRNSGMEGPIGVDMGLEGMSSEISFSEWRPELLKKLGRQERFVFRPMQLGETDFEATVIIATVGGLITVAEPGDLKPGTNSPLKLTMDVRYYRLEMNGEEIWEIDLPNAKRVIGGVDQMASARAAMGF